MLRWLFNLFARKQEIDKDVLRRQVILDCALSGKVLWGKSDSKGNLYYTEGVYGNEIVPSHTKDKALLEASQGKTISGFLPSGLKLPVPPSDCSWKVVRDRVVLVNKDECPVKETPLWKLESQE